MLTCKHDPTMYSGIVEGVCFLFLVIAGVVCTTVLTDSCAPRVAGWLPFIDCCHEDLLFFKCKTPYYRAFSLIMC